MYPSDQHNPQGDSGPSTALKIAAGILIGIVLFLVIGGIGGAIGYWWGYKSAENQNTNAKAVTPSPTPSVSPTPTPSPSPTPTPDLAGKYPGPTGEVSISKVTKKGFSFSISVGNDNGSGGIEGQASWTTPTVAVYSQIPDQELYDDPESSYYKKKCKLTFRFTGQQVKVSEDEFVCNYWHGAAVNFEGTFGPPKKK